MKLYNQPNRKLGIIAATFMAILGANSAYSATIYVGHGIPGEDAETALSLAAGTLDPTLPVDVMVNNGCLLTGFTLGEFSGPLTLPEGSYTISIHPADTTAPCSTSAVIGPAEIPVSGDANATILAHLTENGDLSASVFPNDISMTEKANKGRVQLHHAAAAPAVDISLQRKFRPRVTIDVNGVSNGDFATAEVSKRMWQVSFAPAGTDDEVYKSEVLPIDTDTATQAYAIGSLTNGTFEVISNNLRLRRN